MTNSEAAMKLSTQPEDIEALFTRHLLPGEGLLWSGRPEEVGAFALSDPANQVIGLAFLISGVLTLAWTPFGLLFVAGGWYFAFGGPQARARRRSRLRYAVTDQRIIIWSAGKVRGHMLSSLNGLMLVKRPGANTGTLAFGPYLVVLYEEDYGFAHSWGPWIYREVPPRFWNIPDAERVHALVAAQLSLACRANRTRNESSSPPQSS